MAIVVFGIDLAKNVFAVHGRAPLGPAVLAAGHAVLPKPNGRNRCTWVSRGPTCS